MKIKIDYKCDECKKRIKADLLKKIKKIILNYPYIFNDEANRLIEKINKI